MHANIRSIPRNIKKFESYLTNLDYQFKFLAFSETWLKPHNYDNYNIPDYSAEHNYRPDRAGGGVSLYIKNFIEYTVESAYKRLQKNKDFFQPPITISGEILSAWKNYLT